MDVYLVVMSAGSMVAHSVEHSVVVWVANSVGWLVLQSVDPTAVLTVVSWAVVMAVCLAELLVG